MLNIHTFLITPPPPLYSSPSHHHHRSSVILFFCISSYPQRTLIFPSCICFLYFTFSFSSSSCLSSGLLPLFLHPHPPLIPLTFFIIHLVLYLTSSFSNILYLLFSILRLPRLLSLVSSCLTSILFSSLSSFSAILLSVFTFSNSSYPFLSFTSLCSCSLFSPDCFPLSIIPSLFFLFDAKGMKSNYKVQYNCDSESTLVSFPMRVLLLVKQASFEFWVQLKGHCCTREVAMFSSWSVN